MADPTIDSDAEAGNVARLIQQGKITGPARDAAMQALRDYDTTSKAAAIDPSTGMTEDAWLKHLQDWHQQQYNDLPASTRFVYGAGHAIEDLGRGIGEWFGAVSPKEVELDREATAPMQKDPTAKWGAFAGNVAATAPTMLIPGLGEASLGSTLGAAGLGAGLGAIQPTVKGDETVKNALVGALGGAAGPWVARGAGAVGSAVGAALRPLFPGGARAIASSTLRASAGGPQAAAQAAQRLSTPVTTPPGVQPTAADLSGNAGIAQLDRTLRNQPENTQAFAERDAANSAALVNALRGIAGNDSLRASAEDLRSAVSDPLYRAAQDVRVPADEDLNALLQRPSVEDAWARAQRLAQERGEQLVQGRDIPPTPTPRPPPIPSATPTPPPATPVPPAAASTATPTTGRAAFQAIRNGPIEDLIAARAPHPDLNNVENIDFHQRVEAEIGKRIPQMSPAEVAQLPDAENLLSNVLNDGQLNKLLRNWNGGTKPIGATNWNTNQKAAHAVQMMKDAAGVPTPPAAAPAAAQAAARPAAPVPPGAAPPPGVASSLPRPALLHPADEAEGNSLVTADVGALDAGWAQRGMRVAEGGEGGIEEGGVSRYDRARDLYQAGHTMDAPSVAVDQHGGVTFIDGRHRFAAMRDLGDSAAQVAMDPESITNARNAGMLLEPQHVTDYSGRALQYLKMGLQDAANQAEQRGMGAHELAALNNTLGGVQGWITRNVPELRAADEAFAQGSAPINRMDVGRELVDRLTPALSDFSNAPTRLNANAFANTVRNGDQLAARVTGQKDATLQSILAPDQMDTINQVGAQLARRASAQDLGRAVGSNTGQNLAGQALIRSFLGPLGLPESAAGRAAGSFLGQTLARPYGWAAQAAQPDVLRELTNALLDPQTAAALLRAPQSGAVGKALARVPRRITPLSAETALAAQPAQ